MIGVIVTLDGDPRELCTRAVLRAALDRLHRVAGVRLIAAFEHEFQLMGTPARSNEAYGREGFEQQREMCETLIGVLPRWG